MTTRLLNGSAGWHPSSPIDDHGQAPEHGREVHQVKHSRGNPDRARAWLRGALLALAALAIAAAAVSWEAQYVLVRSVKHSPAVAALEAGIPDVGALIFAALGIALALHGKRAIRRALNVACAGVSLAMNALASAPGWRDLAIWVMPSALYALARLASAACTKGSDLGGRELEDLGGWADRGLGRLQDGVPLPPGEHAPAVTQVDLVGVRAGHADRPAFVDLLLPVTVVGRDLGDLQWKLVLDMREVEPEQLQAEFLVPRLADRRLGFGVLGQVGRSAEGVLDPDLLAGRRLRFRVDEAFGFGRLERLADRDQSAAFHLQVRGARHPPGGLGHHFPLATGVASWAKLLAHAPRLGLHGPPALRHLGMGASQFRLVVARRRCRQVPGTRGLLAGVLFLLAGEAERVGDVLGRPRGLPLVGGAPQHELLVGQAANVDAVHVAEDRERGVPGRTRFGGGRGWFWPDRVATVVVAEHLAVGTDHAGALLPVRPCGRVIRHRAQSLGCPQRCGPGRVLADPLLPAVHRGPKFGHEPDQVRVAGLWHALGPPPLGPRHGELQPPPHPRVDHARRIPDPVQRAGRDGLLEHRAAVQPGGLGFP